MGCFPSMGASGKVIFSSAVAKCKELVILYLTLFANNKSFSTESDSKESSSQRMKYGLQIEHGAAVSEMGSKKPIQRALLGYLLKSKRWIQLFRQTACLMAWLEKLKKSSEIYLKNISFKILSSLYCSAPERRAANKVGGRWSSQNWRTNRINIILNSDI